MRDRGAYYVVREAHKVEDDQQVCLESVGSERSSTDRNQIKEAIERLVGLIEGDESHETREQHVEHLVRGAAGPGSKETEVSGEMDVQEV